MNAVLSFDSAVSIAVRHWPAGLHGLMVMLTTIGQPLAMALAATAVSIFAWQRGKRHTAYGFAMGVLAMIADLLLKQIINRPRPDTAYAHTFHSGSFPSEHAFGAAIICGLLAYLAMRRLSRPWGRGVAVCLIIFAVGVGVSRVYLGAHYPTDVLAGWALGGLSAVLIARYIRP